MRIAPLLIVLLAACGVARRPSDTTPAPGPAEPAPGPAPRASGEGGPWAFAWVGGSYAYEIASETTIELRGDSLPAEQVRTTTHVTYALAPTAGAGADVQGSVDSVVVEPMTRSGAPGRVSAAREQVLASPISFSARLDAERRRVDFPPLGASACASAAERTAAGAALVTARDLLVALPATLAPRATWRDTVTSTVCRGDVPVATTAVRTYVVESMDEWEGAPALRVRRTSELRVSGEKGGRRPARLDGTGTVTQRLFLDPAGRLLGATAEASAELRMTAGEESGELRQRVRTRVRLVGGR